MCHLGYIVDSEGDLVDLNYYCSDSCNAEHNVNYAGWNGCHENHSSEVCANCLCVIPAAILEPLEV